MRIARLKRLLIAALLLAAPHPSLAQKDDARETQARQIWQSLSPERKEKILANYRRYQTLTPAQKESINNRYERFQKLTPEGKSELIERWTRFQSLPPSRQAQFRNTFEKEKAPIKPAPRTANIRKPVNEFHRTIPKQNTKLIETNKPEESIGKKPPVANDKTASDTKPGDSDKGGKSEKPKQEKKPFVRRPFRRPAPPRR